jgi:hypothetical protein
VSCLNCGKPSEDGGVKQDTTALECPVPGYPGTRVL